jgi:hypothetical protein
MSYWQECIESPFEEAGITATIEQISLIPDAVRCAHENYGMAYPVPENPLINDVVSLKKSLARERPGSPAGDAKGQVAGMHPSASVTSSYEHCYLNYAHNSPVGGSWHV